MNRENDKHDLVPPPSPSPKPSASDLRHSCYFPASAPTQCAGAPRAGSGGAGPDRQRERKRPERLGKALRRLSAGYSGPGAAQNPERVCRGSRASVGAPEERLLSARTPLSPENRRTRPGEACRPSAARGALRRSLKMEEISLANLDTNKLEAIAQEIYVDLIEDSCLGFCFEVHRAVKCGYFYLEFADTGNVKDFGIQPVEDKGACRHPRCSLPGESGNAPQPELQRSPPEFQ
ncbi:ataxin-7 3B [Sigmodon hispidus]